MLGEGRQPVQAAAELGKRRLVRRVLRPSPVEVDRLPSHVSQLTAREGRADLAGDCHEAKRRGHGLEPTAFLAPALFAGWFLVPAPRARSLSLPATPACFFSLPATRAW